MFLMIKNILQKFEIDLPNSFGAVSVFERIFKFAKSGRKTLNSFLSKCCFQSRSEKNLETDKPIDLKFSFCVGYAKLYFPKASMYVCAFLIFKEFSKEL